MILEFLASADFQQLIEAIRVFWIDLQKLFSLSKGFSTAIITNGSGS